MKKSLIPWLLVAVFAGCSSEEPGPQPDSKLKDEQGFCKEWAKAACSDDAVQNCDSTLDRCLEQQAAFCGELIPVGYSSMNAEDCITAVERAYRDAVLTADELQVVVRLEGECSQLVDGGFAPGQTCDSSLQCDTVHGYVCVFKGGAAEGTCQVPQTVPGGYPCSDPAVICSAGFYCNDSNCLSSGYDPDASGADCSEDADCGREEACFEDTCVPSCTFNEMCGASGRCEFPDGADEGHCAPLLANNTACANDAECESGFCQTTADPPECRSRIVLTAESTACDYF